MDFKLIPMYKIEAVVKNWKFFTEGMEKIFHYTTGDTGFTKVLNEILAGELLMWIGFQDSEYCGFITTKFDQYPMASKFLTAVHLYIKEGKDSKILELGFPIIYDFARKNGCDKIRFYTMRDGAFKRKMEPLGWTTGYQEFDYDLTKGDRNETE
jgi:retron-type reverse transcriptase